MSEAKVGVRLEVDGYFPPLPDGIETETLSNVEYERLADCANALAGIEDPAAFVRGALLLLEAYGRETAGSEQSESRHRDMASAAAKLRAARGDPKAERGEV